MSVFGRPELLADGELLVPEDASRDGHPNAINGGVLLHSRRSRQTGHGRLPVLAQRYPKVG